MSKEPLSDNQVLDDYSKVLDYLRKPYIGRLGSIGLSAESNKLMEEIIKRQLLPEAIEIASQTELNAGTGTR